MWTISNPALTAETVGSVKLMDAYDKRVLKVIEKLDREDPEPHPALNMAQVAERMDPPEADLEPVDLAIARLTDAGHLEVSIPAIQQTRGPVSFRLHW